MRYQKLGSLGELMALEYRYENTIYLVPKGVQPNANGGAPAKNEYSEYIWMPNDSDPLPPSEDRPGFVHEISARRVLNPFSVKGVVHGVKPIPVDATKGHWELLGDSEKGDIDVIRQMLADEIQRATIAEGELHKKIGGEQERAETAEKELQENIEAEAQTRESEDNRVLGEAKVYSDSTLAAAKEYTDQEIGKVNTALQGHETRIGALESGV